MRWKIPYKNIGNLLLELRKIPQTKFQASERLINRLIFLSNWVVCGRKKSTLIKNKELNNFNNIWNDKFKMNKIINKFLLARDIFMPELHLKQPGFTDSACEPFTKKIVKEFKYYQVI